MQRKRMPRQKTGNIRLGLDARLERELPCELDAGIAPHLFRARAKDGIAIGFAGDARRAGSLCGVPGLDVLFPYGHAGEKIPVAQGGLTADAPGTKHQPGYDGGIRRLPRSGEKANIGLPADGGTARHVRKAETMPAFALLEVVIDAFFLAKAGEEMQIGLPVLHAVFARRVGLAAFEGEGFAREKVAFQKESNDLRYALVLEYAMIARLTKKPEAGDDEALVVSEVIAPPQAVHFAHQTVDMARLAGAIRYAQQRGRTDEGAEVFIG